MEALQEQFDKVIYNFLGYLENEDSIYTGVKDKYKEWSNQSNMVFETDSEQIKQHCQYKFKKGKMKDTMCLKKTEDGSFCSKHLPKNKEETTGTAETKKCIYIMTSGKRCSKNATTETEHCTVHLKKLANEESDFTVPDIPKIPELMV